MNPKSPFFIVGESRSGTTLLRTMLDCHPGLVIPGESHLIPFLYRRRGAFGDLSLEENRLEMVNAAASMIELSNRKEGWAPGLRDNAAEVAANAGPDFAGVIDSIFRFATKRKPDARWGDKTPRYVLHLPLLLELFPDARFIHIIRDGRDVASSLLPLYFGAHTPLKAGREWNYCVKKGEEFVAAHPEQATSIRYEKLVADPATELARLCEFLGVEFDPVVLEYSKSDRKRPAGSESNPDIHQLLSKPPTTSRVGSYTTRLTSKQLRLVEAGASEMLVKLGYGLATENPKASRAEELLDKVVHNSKELFRTKLKTRAGLIVLARRLMAQEKQRKSQPTKDTAA